MYCACCILEWALHKEEPWCPQCKQPFAHLLTYRALDGTLQVRQGASGDGVGLGAGRGWEGRAASGLCVFVVVGRGGQLRAPCTPRLPSSAQTHTAGTPPARPPGLSLGGVCVPAAPGSLV